MTLNLLYFVGIVLLAWEVWTIVNLVKGDTISATLRKLGRAQTVIPLAMGLLMRHLWGDDEATKTAFLVGWEAGVYWPCIDKEDTPTPAPTPMA